MAGYRINLQESIAFLHTDTKAQNKRSRDTFSLSKKIKFLGINLIKDVKDCCNENSKYLKKEVEKDTRKCKDIICSHGLVELILQK